MKIETRKIKEYRNYTLYGKYKDNKLIYKFCESNMMEKLEYAKDKLGLIVKGEIENGK